MPQQLIPHINHALVPKPHTPMYLMHKFWARKPDNVVAEYINHYSRKGSITLDPFCGSGVTPIESLRLRRKAIATDIDPMSTFITRMSIVPVDLIEYEKTFETIQERVRSKIDELYQTSCPKCGGKAHVICTYWHNDEATDIRNLVCPVDGMVRGKTLDLKDKENLESIKKKDIPFWVPQDKLQYLNGKDFKEGTHVKGLDSVPSLFTRRNLIALSILKRALNSNLINEDINYCDCVIAVTNQMIATLIP